MICFVGNDGARTSSWTAPAGERRRDSAAGIGVTGAVAPRTQLDPGIPAFDDDRPRGRERSLLGAGGGHRREEMRQARKCDGRRAHRGFARSAVHLRAWAERRACVDHEHTALAFAVQRISGYASRHDGVARK